MCISRYRTQCIIQYTIDIVKFYVCAHARLPMHVSTPSYVCMDKAYKHIKVVFFTISCVLPAFFIT
jgi:hypothetical protein